MVTKSTQKFLLYWEDFFAFQVARAREEVWQHRMLLKAHPHEHFINALRQADEKLATARSRTATIRLILAQS